MKAYARQQRSHGFRLVDHRPLAWCLTLKGLRHTWATLALEQGIHPPLVQERLGHSTIAITLDTYSHVRPTLHDDAAQLIADLVLEA